MNNKIIGSVLIVVGSTVGGGMLAIPLVSAQIGFLTTFAILVAIWALCYFTSALYIDILEHSKINSSFDSLSRDYLGKAGAIVNAIFIGFLLYSACCAFISGGGGVINAILSDIFHTQVPHATGILIFGGTGALLIFLGTVYIDIVNRFLIIAKIVFLFVTIGILTPYINSNFLLKLPTQYSLVALAMPMIFTSFAFHHSIPSIVKYIGEYNKKKLKIIFFIGSIIPLVIYVFWSLAILGTIPEMTLQTAKTPEQLLDIINGLHGSFIIKTCASIFMAIAPATSFLGMILGLYDYIEDILEGVRTKNNIKTKFISLLLTFVPPIFIALALPNVFLKALEFTSISIIYSILILPVLLYIQSRKKHNETYSQAKKIILLSTMLLGVVIIIIQVKELL